MKQSTKNKQKTQKPRMRIFNSELTPKTKWQLFAIFLVFIFVLVWFFYSYFRGGVLYRLAAFLSDKEAVREAITSMGVFAPLVFMSFQILQTVISPIPANVVSVVGGFIFGWWGIIFSTIGCLIGYSIVLNISRRLGRSFVEKLISKDLLSKFDYLTRESGSLVFFIIFLIPALPDDVAMYLAGLTKIPIPQMLFLATVGRLPSVAVANQFGSSISDQNILEVVLLAAFTLVIVGLCIWQRKFILELVGPRRRALISRIKKRVKKSISDCKKKAAARRRARRSQKSAKTRKS